MLNTKGFYRLIDFYQSPILIYYAVPFITEETTNWVIITGAELCGLNMVELQKDYFCWTLKFFIALPVLFCFFSVSLIKKNYV